MTRPFHQTLHSLKSMTAHSDLLHMMHKYSTMIRRTLSLAARKTLIVLTGQAACYSNTGRLLPQAKTVHFLVLCKIKIILPVKRQ